MKAKYSKVPKAIRQEIVTTARQIVDDERLYNEYRMLALVCIELNENKRFRFGKDRLYELIAGVRRQSDSYKKWDELRGEQMVKALRRIGLDDLAENITELEEEMNVRIY